jgi:hypothetical protein
MCLFLTRRTFATEEYRTRGVGFLLPSLLE